MIDSIGSLARRDAGVIALTYLLTAAAWIVGSDYLLTHAIPPGPALDLFQTSKGIAFVLVTAVILFTSVRRLLHQRLTIERILGSTQSFREAVFQSASDAILLLDESWTIHDANTKAEEYYGRTRAELRGLDLAAIRAVESIGSIRSDMERVAREGSARWESTHRHRSGRTFPVEVSTRRMDWEGSRYYIHVVRDITERRMAADQLKAQRDLLSDMERIAQVGGWEFDVATGRGTWTDEVARIHEMDPADETNASKGLSFYQGESRMRIERAVQDAITLGRPYDLELELVAPSGTRKWVHTIGRPVFRDGTVVQLRGSFQDITVSKRAEQELADTNAQLRSLALKLETAREEERKHMAREIHDVLGQELTAVRMDLSMALAATSLSEAQEEIRRSIAVTERAIGSVRRMARELRPAVLDQLGLAEALRSLAAEHTEHSRIPCTVAVDTGGQRLDDHVSISLYRIAQEALTNIARHANARSASLSLHQRGTSIELVIDDDGRGIAGGPAPGRLGLLGMRERVMALGGSCEIAPRPEGGTRVSVRVERGKPLAGHGT